MLNALVNIWRSNLDISREHELVIATVCSTVKTETPDAAAAAAAASTAVVQQTPQQIKVRY